MAFSVIRGEILNTDQIIKIDKYGGDYYRAVMTSGVIIKPLTKENILKIIKTHTGDVELSPDITKFVR
jgi:hypothetical protein